MRTTTAALLVGVCLTTWCECWCASRFQRPQQETIKQHHDEHQSLQQHQHDSEQPTHSNKDPLNSAECVYEDPHSDISHESDYKNSDDSSFVEEFGEERNTKNGIENIPIHPTTKSQKPYVSPQLSKTEQKFDRDHGERHDENMMMGDREIRTWNFETVIDSPSFVPSNKKSRYAGDQQYDIVRLEKRVEFFLGDFNLGKFSRSKCNFQQSEGTRHKLKQLLMMYKELKEDSGLWNFLSHNPDVTNMKNVIARLTTLLEAISGLSLSSDCHLLPFDQIKFLTRIILQGEENEPSVPKLMDSFHHMIMGHPSYFASESVLSVFTKRLQFSQKQSKRWHLEAIYYCLTLIQIGGSAVLMTALNVEKRCVSDRIVPVLLDRFYQQSQMFAKIALETDDIYSNRAWNELSMFLAKREQDQNISIDVGIIGIYDNSEIFTLNSAKGSTFHNVNSRLNRAGNTENDRTGINRSLKAGRRQNNDAIRRSNNLDAMQKKGGNAKKMEKGDICNSLPDLEDGKLSFITGCEFGMKKGGVLALRCNAVPRQSCQSEVGLTESVLDDVYLWQGSRGVISEVTSKKRKCVRPPNKLSCVDTTWISTNDTSQTICAVKLHVKPKSPCLSIGVYFCAKNACTHSDQGWVTDSFSHETTAPQNWNDKSKNSPQPTKPLTSENDASNNMTKIDSRMQEWLSHEVDSNLVLPELDGWLSGIRLYIKGGRLAISLKTSF